MYKKMHLRFSLVLELGRSQGADGLNSEHLLCGGTSQGRRKRGGWGGLSRPTFLGNLNYELVHSVESAIEDKRVDSLWQCSRSR